MWRVLKYYNLLKNTITYLKNAENDLTPVLSITQLTPKVLEMPN